MEFKLNFELSKPHFTIKHGEGMVFLGSCFSDEIAEKARYSGMNVSANPFGTVFHPTLLSTFINESIKGVVNERILNRNDVFLSWDANSTIFDYGSSELIEKLQQIRNNFINEVKSAKVLFVTFGTAWIYRRLEDDHFVANCHKIAATHFSKELISSDTIYHQWEKTVDILKELNPTLEIVFTVSPVRHIKDGLVENNQSKAILIDVVRRLTEKYSLYYFPSYEIVIDELRDYRFYKKDRVHPSDEAIEYIWRRFEILFYDKDTIDLNHQVEAFRRVLSHKSIHSGVEDQLQKETNEKRLNEFLKTHPAIRFN